MTVELLPAIYAVIPGITPHVSIPYFVDILEDGIILIPHEIVLPETHLLVASYGSDVHKLSWKALTLFPPANG